MLKPPPLFGRRRHARAAGAVVTAAAGGAGTTPRRCDRALGAGHTRPFLPSSPTSALPPRPPPSLTPSGQPTPSSAPTSVSSTSGFPASSSGGSTSSDAPRFLASAALFLLFATAQCIVASGLKCSPDSERELCCSRNLIRPCATGLPWTDKATSKRRKQH